MRHRINVSITPVFHDELQRICKDYGFVNLCEICTALLRVFVCDGVSVYDLDFLEKSYGPGSDDDGEQYDY